GAHNPEGIRALVDELNDWHHGRKITLLFATMADKEWELMLRAVTKAVDEVVFTRVNMERSADPRRLAEQMREPTPHRVMQNSRLDMGTLRNESEPNDVILGAAP